MKKKAVQLSIGCLIHDIGKMVFRAGLGSDKHNRLGRDFLRELWPDEREILDCVMYHHARDLRAAALSDDSPAYLVCVADNLAAAADRRETQSGDAGFVRRLPLSSIFTHLNGEHPGYTVPPYRQDSCLRMPEKGETHLHADQYLAAVDALKLQLARLPREEEWLDSLLALLEGYTSMFPSSTYMGESPDISLYDHLKITAAIGSCIGEYLADQEETNYRSRVFEQEEAFGKEKAFLLYSADFSGIQSFLYTVATKGAMRSLRSRSFFLEISMEHYCDELLRLCGVSRANLLYSGGGHCYALLPNTESVKKSLEQWNADFNKWLCSQFGIRLFLAHGYTACSGNELCNRPAKEAPYKAMFQRVSSAISRHKLQRYDADGLRWLNREERVSGRECRICGRADQLVGDRCSWCGLFERLAEKLQNQYAGRSGSADDEQAKNTAAPNIYYVSMDAGEDYDFLLPTPEGNAYISLCDEKSARARLQSGDSVRRIYSKNESYMGLRSGCRIYVGDYVYSNRMDLLAESSRGIRRIGICRMDVDDLGHSFVAGFEKEREEKAELRQHYVTLSRTAAFSRQLSLFFKCYINDILSGRFENREALAVGLIYSGGDDVFLVGAWQDVIEAACRLQRALERFSCGALRISAGICLVNENHPVRLSAMQAGQLEDRAKKQPGKNAVALFDYRQDHCYSWQTFREKVLGEKLTALNEFFEKKDNNERGSSFLYRILQLLREAELPGGRLALARYAYLLARLQPSAGSSAYAGYRSFSDKMYRWALEETERRQLITAIYIFVYENRTKED